MNDGQWRYVAGLPVSAEAPLMEGMVELEIPARQYARVEHRGTVQTLPETFRAAYSEWLPAAGMRADEGVEFEYAGGAFFRADAPGQRGRTLYSAENLMPRSDKQPTR
ncbi:GyrI-like domain-containing protein [Pseudomonas chlororaphis]|uniref:GyrI-like domain-containing protein n=1 Tax=Pseudomonas chlororaphis TaxID=587753 RepID=UPI000A81BA60|nr:GyrI-like domain-containing protein [Pseudomonas chlororaphis]